MADRARRWRLALPERAGYEGSGGGGPAPLAWTGTDGPGGHPLYASEDGRVRAEIADSGLVFAVHGEDGLRLTLCCADGLVFLTDPGGGHRPGAAAYARPVDGAAPAEDWPPGPR